MVDIIGFKEMLIDDFIVMREEFTQQDEIGGRRKSFFEVGTFKGRLSEVGGEGFEVVRSGQNVAYVDHILFCLVDTKIRKSDYVKVSGDYYQVIYKKSPTEDLNHHLEVGLEQIQPSEVGIGGL